MIEHHVKRNKELIDVSYSINQKEKIFLFKLY